MINNCFVGHPCVWLTGCQWVAQCPVGCLNILQQLLAGPMNALSLASWDCSFLNMDCKVLQACGAIFITGVADEWLLLACILIKLPLICFAWGLFNVCCNNSGLNILWRVMSNDLVFDMVCCPRIAGRWPCTIVWLLIPAPLRIQIWILVELDHILCFFFSFLL